MFTNQKDGKFMALLVYVDDLVVSDNDSDTCLAFKANLNSYLHKRLGTSQVFPGH